MVEFGHQHVLVCFGICALRYVSHEPSAMRWLAIGVGFKNPGTMHVTKAAVRLNDPVFQIKGPPFAHAFANLIIKSISVLWMNAFHPVGTGYFILVEPHDFAPASV